jgi:signal transduction histidine kinase
VQRGCGVLVSGRRPVASVDSNLDDEDRAARAAGHGGAVNRPLRLLLLEASDDDAALVTHELRRGGYLPACTRVATREAFRSALFSRDWDVVVADFGLPAYSGLRALADLHASGKDIPFILVSGTIGEAGAISAMKAGAHDYVLKGDLSRLPVAVERELRETAVRAEQVRMRERLVVSERMASAGTLAAGVAHEINNPLAIAMTNLEFVSETLARVASDAREPGAQRIFVAEWSGLSELGALDEAVRDTREALARMRDIVKDVKLFSRPQEDKTEAVDVQRVIESSIRMAWNEIRHRAQIARDYGPVPLVNANESRLGQVLLNLIVNAAQSMAEGHADRNELRIATRTDQDGHAVVEVSDTGAGIPRENLERIFDPFFTTKPAGSGTGLGLAICQRIVHELGGRIEVESAVGRGALFRVVLPAARESQNVKVSTVRPTSGHRARVLVVDDEPAMGRALQRTLREHLDVVALTSAKEALARISGGERFEVILSDVMMPEVSGMELYQSLMRIAPEQAQRMIFVTGGAFTPAAREFLDHVPNPRIEKPVEATNLLAMVAGLTSPQAP